MNNWPIVVRWPHGNLANTPVLRLDAAGRRAAKRHIEEGGRGALAMQMPTGLADWMVDGLRRREKALLAHLPRAMKKATLEYLGAI